MAFLNETFNTAELPEEQGGFDPIPAGDYHLVVAESELKDTKKGDGQYIWLKMSVVGPTHQGRILFANLNIRNPNPKAEDIGRQQLGSVLRAIGVASLTDTDQLIGGNMTCKVTVKNDPTYGPGNEIKGFKAVTGSPVPAPAGQAAPAQASGATPPWMKK
jgi:hypothetical protein